MTDTEVICSAPKQYQAILDSYVSILEKTNNQLGVGVNLSTLSVAILSIIIAVIAIFVTVVISINSKDQKERYKQFLLEQEKTIQDKAKQITDKYDELINERRNELKKADEEDKGKIQERIDELEEEKSLSGLTAESGLIGGNLSALNINHPYYLNGARFLNPRSTICAKCDKVFNYNNPIDLSFSGAVSLGGETVYCTHCGAANTVFF